jgi:hypothetical protein
MPWRSPNRLRSDRGAQRAGHSAVDLNRADRAVQPVSQQLARSRMITDGLTLGSKGGFMAGLRTGSPGQLQSLVNVRSRRLQPWTFESCRLPTAREWICAFGPTLVSAALSRLATPGSRASTTRPCGSPHHHECNHQQEHRNQHDDEHARALGDVS